MESQSPTQHLNALRRRDPERSKRAAAGRTQVSPQPDSLRHWPRGWAGRTRQVSCTGYQGRLVVTTEWPGVGCRTHTCLQARPVRSVSSGFTGVAPPNMATDLHAYPKGLNPPLLSSRPAQSPHQQDAPNLERPLSRAKGKRSRSHRAPVEDRQKAEQRILPEQPQPEAPPALAPKVFTRFPTRSNTYLIIGLQNELTKCGALKNMTDYEDFWKLAQEEVLGVEMKEKLQRIRFKLMNPRPWLPAASRRKETRMSVSADQDSGACQGTQSLLSRLTEWRKRCQQRGVAPELPGGQRESKITGKTKTASRSNVYLSRLYQMYSTSLANMEFSRRLLERDGRFADVRPEHGAGSLMDYLVPSRHEQTDAPPRETEVENPLAPGQQLQASPALRFLKYQSAESPRRSSQLKTGRHQVTLCGIKKACPGVNTTGVYAQKQSECCPRETRSKLSEQVRGKLVPEGLTADPRPTAPLTLDHVIQTHPVVGSLRLPKDGQPEREVEERHASPTEAQNRSQAIFLELRGRWRKIHPLQQSKKAG
ncbi:uncharacterized protein LOC101843709 isoform X2 [Mesocricetus auratus]|uniref:Uncharacterized protein LOC101843709 isoform X2 n=1 Tax=Mesocricetus auratus TaxID=10036 RepID=A0ABM2YHK1_MESAU|nr:uncharacterized protein LOC101843709 isoform X2 [Mesocricetus auratus]